MQILGLAPIRSHFNLVSFFFWQNTTYFLFSRRGSDACTPYLGPFLVSMVESTKALCFKDLSYLVLKRAAFTARDKESNRLPPHSSTYKRDAQCQMKLSLQDSFQQKRVEFRIHFDYQFERFTTASMYKTQHCFPGKIHSDSKSMADGWL